MALQVKWTENALTDYRIVVEYLLQQWSVESASGFIDIVEKRIEILSVFPKIGIASLKYPEVRSIVVTKHNKLYYRASEECIEVLNIFDTRQVLQRIGLISQNKKSPVPVQTGQDF